MEKVTMVVEGGAMRNAFTSAVLARWQERGFSLAQVEKVYATSSGAPTALFFMDGKSAAMERVWIDQLTRWDVYNPLNILMHRQCADMEKVLDLACRDLDLSRVDDWSARLIVTVIRRDDGTTHYVPCTAANVRQLLIATCSLPLVSDWAVVDGQVLVDGGLSDPMPVLKAHEDGARKILVMSNRPPYERPLQWWEKSLNHRIFAKFPEMHKTVMGMPRHYARTKKFLRNPPAGTDVFTVNPGRFLQSTRFTRSKKKVRYDMRYGKKVADRMWDDLQAFLQR